MREITSVYYSKPDESQVYAEYNNGVRVPREIPLDPTNFIDIEIQAWLDASPSTHIFQSYDEYRDVSDQSLLISAYELNLKLAGLKVIDAKATPEQGLTLSRKDRVLNDKRRDNRAKRNNQMTVNDELLADYIDLVYDTHEQADITVDSLDRAGLIAWDGSAITWPMWTPPVP